MCSSDVPLGISLNWSVSANVETASEGQILLKIPALPPHRLGVELRLPHRLHHEVDDVGLVLQGAADAHERECLDGDAEPFIDVLPQEDVDEAGLVFEGDEDDAPGGLGALAADDDAGVVHAAAVGHSLYGGGVGKALGGDLWAQVGQRMARGLWSVVR